MRAYYFLFFFIFLTYLYILVFEVGVREDATELQNEKAQNKWLIIVSFIPIIALTALRSSEVGPDTIQYLRHFERVYSGMETAVDIRNFERGYRYFVRLIAHFTHDKVVFLTIMALLTNIPIAIFIMRYSKDAYLSIMLYLTIGSFTFQLTGIRQSIALAILTFSVGFALDRKPLWFLISIYFASLFHRSAYLFAPIYLLGSDVINRKTFFMIVVSALFVAFSDSIFSRIGLSLRYDEYMVSDGGVKNFGGWTYIAIMVITMFVYFFNKHFNKEAFDRTDQFFFIVLLFALALYILRYQNRVAERVSLYYRMALIIILPNAIHGRENESMRNVVAILCTIFAVALFIYWTLGSRYIYTPFWRYM